MVTEGGGVIGPSGACAEVRAAASKATISTCTSFAARSPMGRRSMYSPDSDCGPWLSSSSQPRRIRGCSVLDSTPDQSRALPRVLPLSRMKVRLFGESVSMPPRQPKLKPQHAPKPPHEDLDFLQSTPARPLRIMAE